MERFEMPKINPEKENPEKLADDAQARAAGLDLKRFPDMHVYAALDAANIRGEDRKRLIPKIKKILHRRDLKFSKREDLKEDARNAEARHPKDDEDGA